MDEQMTGSVCQSCGMPMTKPEDFGTNADGTQNVEYCNFCYQNGAFTMPDITVEELIENVSGMIAEAKNMPVEEAKAVAQAILPQLKRWAK